MIHVVIDTVRCGDVFTQTLEEKNISLKELSINTSISVYELRQYQRGIKVPPLKKMISIANALNKSLDELILYYDYK